MASYPVKCKVCGTMNTITKDVALVTKDCDEKKCKNCGQKGMEYPRLFDNPEK